MNARLRVVGVLLVVAGIPLAIAEVRAPLNYLGVPQPSFLRTPAGEWFQTSSVVFAVPEFILALACILIAVWIANRPVARIALAVTAVGFAVYGLFGVVVLPNSDPNVVASVIQAVLLVGCPTTAILTIRSADHLPPGARLFAVSMLLIASVGVIFFGCVAYSAINGFAFYSINPSGVSYLGLAFPDGDRDVTVCLILVAAAVLQVLAGRLLFRFADEDPAEQPIAV